MVVVVALVASGCSRQDRQLEQHRDKFASFGATVAATGDAWLNGHVSGTYTLATLEQTLALVERERTKSRRRPVCCSIRVARNCRNPRSGSPA